MRSGRPWFTMPASFVLLSAVITSGAMPEDHSQWSDPVFRSAYKLIATPGEWAVLDTLHRWKIAPYLELFWKRRDPTPTTPENEFKRQFEERVATTLEKYPAIPNPAPWDKRGEVYIKLGEPDELQQGVNRYYKLLGRGEPDFDLSMRTEGEIWYYFGRNLILQFQGPGLEYKLVPFMPLAPSDRIYDEYPSLADFADHQYQIETTHVAYLAPEGTQEVPMALDWYAFRRLDGDYDVYVACAVPLRALARRTGYRAGDLSYRARVMAFDSSLQMIWKDSADIKRAFSELPRRSLAQNQWVAVLPPGFYVIAAEIDDPAGTKHAARSFDRWLVPYADSVALDLSPLVVAASVLATADSTGRFIRNGHEIVPMPSHVFRVDQDVAFYHEVYNLKPDTAGLCRYIIEYSLYDRKRRTRQKLAIREFSSQEIHTYQAGKIPRERLHKGDYVLEVKTHDLNAEMTRTALSSLKVH